MLSQHCGDSIADAGHFAKTKLEIPARNVFRHRSRRADWFNLPVRPLGRTALDVRSFDLTRYRRLRYPQRFDRLRLPTAIAKHPAVQAGAPGKPHECQNPLPRARRFIAACHRADTRRRRRHDGRPCAQSAARAADWILHHPYRSTCNRTKLDCIQP